MITLLNWILASMWRRNKKAKIEFVAYTGKYPSLCSGAFLVKIDGVLTVFYYSTKKEEVLAELSYAGIEETPKEYFQSFWTTGGGTDWRKDKCYYGKWKLAPYSNNFPKHIKELLPELLKVFNENVEHGCCGGCI